MVRHRAVEAVFEARRIRVRHDLGPLLRHECRRHRADAHARGQDLLGIHQDDLHIAIPAQEDVCAEGALVACGAQQYREVPLCVERDHEEVNRVKRGTPVGMPKIRRTICSVRLWGSRHRRRVGA